MNNMTEQHEYDADHPLVEKVREWNRERGESYVLSDDELGAAKKLVNRGFLFYSQDLQRVMAYRR